MLVALMVMVALDFAGSSVSITIFPVKSLNAPRTFVTIACRATKPILLCAGSIV
jgi:hypothetical protein